MITANFLGVISGRAIITTVLAGRLPDRFLLACCASIGCAFYLLLIVTASYRLALVWMFCAGLGMCGDMIALTSFTATRFREEAAKAFGYYAGSRANGLGAGPLSDRPLGRLQRFERAIWIAPATISMIALTGFSWERMDRRQI